MANQAVFGLRIDLVGAPAAASAVTTITTSVTTLGAAAGQAGEQASQAFQEIGGASTQAATAMQAGATSAAAALRETTSAAQEAAQAARAEATAQREAAAQLSNRESFLAGLRETVDLFGRSAVEVLEYRAALAGASAEAAPLIAELGRLGAVQAQAAAAAREEAAAQREAAQQLASRDAFLAGLQEQVALFGRSELSALEYRAALAGVSAEAAPLIAELRQLGATQAAAAAAARSEAQAQQQAAQVQTSREQFIEELRRETEALGQTRAQMLQLRAAQLGVTDEAAPFIARLNETGMSARANAAAMRGVPAQVTDIFTSLQGGMPVLTVAMQQGGQLRDMFGGVGAAARALSSYLVSLISPFTVAAAVALALAVAYNQGSKETESYRQALILTGNAAGTTTGQLTGMAAAVAANTKDTKGHAADALAQLVATGRASVDNLEKMGTAAVAAQKAIGTEISATVGAFTDLARSPLDASVKLSEQYHYLTSATYAQIKALSDQGRADDAAKVAQSAYADAIIQRSKDIEAALPPVQRAWAAIKGAAIGAWDAMLGVGREQTLDEKLKEVQAKLEKLNKPQQSLFGGSVGFDTPGGNAADAKTKAKLEKEKSDIEDAIDAERRRAAIAASRNKLDQDDIQWQQQGEKLLTRQAQLQRDLVANRTLGLEAGRSDVEIETRAAEIRKSYADIYNSGIDSQIEAIKRRGAIEDEISGRSRTVLEASRAANLVTERDYLSQVESLDEADFNRQKSRLQEELDLTKRKVNSQKDQAALSGQIALADQQATSRRLKLQSDLAVLDAKNTKAIKDQSDAWRNATATESQALADETALFGQSSEARRIAAEQLKVEADLRQFVTNYTKQGHAFSTQELADLEAAAEARQKSIASIMGERQALAGAEELRQANARFAAESIVDDKARAAKLLEIDSDTWRERIALAGEGTEAQRRLQEQYNTWYANQLAKPMLDEQREAVKKYGDVFRTGFADMLNNGKAGWKSFTTSLVTTFKTSVAEQLYKMLAQPFVVNFVGNMLGVTSSAAGSVGSAAQTVSSGANLLSNASSASSAYNLVTAGISNSIGTGIATAGNFLGSSSLSAFGAGFANVGGTAMTAAETFSAAGMTAEASAASLGASVSAALPYVAAAVVAYKAWNALFEDGPESDTRLTFASNNKAGAISINERGNEGKSDAYIGGASTNSAFGTFGVSSTFWAPAESETVKSFVKTVGAADDALAKYLTTQEKANVTSYLTTKTDTAHVGAEGEITSEGSAAALAQVFNNRLMNILDGLEPGLSALEQGFSGTSAELATEVQALLAYRQALAQSGEAVFGVKVTMQEIAALKQPSEATSVALNRITEEFVATNAVAAALGRDAATAFGAAGLQSTAARENLIALAGGVDALSQQAAGFATNFLTPAERLAPVAKELGVQLNSLGLASIPTTRDEFKALVQSLDPLNAEQAKQLAGLLGLQAAFAEVHPATEAATSAAESMSAILDVQAQMYEVLGDKAGAAAVLEQQHALALKDMAPALAAASQALWDAQAATQAAKAAADEAAAILEQQAAMYEANGDQAGAAAVLLQQHQAALKELSPALAAATQATWDAQAAQKASQEAASQTDAILSARAQMYQALGDTAGAAAVLMEQHRIALEKLAPAVQVATQAMWDAEAAEKARADAAAEASTILDLQAQTAEARGDTAAAAAILEQQHIAALKSLQPAVASATQELWAAQAAQKALAEAASTYSSLLTQQAAYYTATGDTAALARVVEAQRTESLKGQTAEVVAWTRAAWAEQDAATARTEALKNESALLEQQARVAAATGDAAAAAAIKARQQEIALEGLSPALQAATQAAQDAEAAAAQRNSIDSLTIELLQAQGRSQEAVNLQRKAELSALNETEAALKSAAYAAADLAKTQSLQIQLLQAQGNDAAATALQRKQALDGLSDGDKIIQQAIYDQLDKNDADKAAAAIAQQFAQAQAAAAEAQRQAAEEAVQAAQAVQEAWQSSTDSIMDEVARIRGSAATTETLAGAEANFQIAMAQARAGDQEAYKSLPQLAETLLDLLDKSDVSQFELTAGRARVAGALETVATSTAGVLGLKLPSFDVGADSLPRDMIAQVHEGEGILTKSQNVAFSKFINDPATTMAGVVDEVTLLRGDVRQVGEKIDNLAEVINDGNKVIALRLINIDDRMKRWDVLGVKSRSSSEAETEGTT